MRILHIAPIAPYNAEWSYQENLLPKYQRKQGHEVWIVVSPFENSTSGKIDVGEGEFDLSDGVRVFRRRRTFGDNFLGKMISHTDVKDIISSFQPNLIMVHSLMTLAVFQAIRYKKQQNPECVIIQDNHLDENIGWRKNKILTGLFYGYWAIINRFSSPYVARYYGVTPWRRDFIIDRFKIDPQKTDVLIMGADMDDIDFSKREDYRKEIDIKYGTAGKFLLVTGGKIERNKKTDVLMEAIRIRNDIKLLVFGNVSEEYRADIKRSINENVIMLGWNSSHEINKLFLAADLAIFPGQHSVLWEQACACKIPCLFGYWQGMEHLNNGGNCAFLMDVSVEGLRKALEQYCYTEEYEHLLTVAQSEATDIFSYDHIARKSLEMAFKSQSDSSYGERNGYA